MGISDYMNIVTLKNLLLSIGGLQIFACNWHCNTLCLKWQIFFLGKNMWY
jgi:hypothetical protein